MSCRTLAEIAVAEEPLGREPGRIHCGTPTCDAPFAQFILARACDEADAAVADSLMYLVNMVVSGNFVSRTQAHLTMLAFTLSIRLDTDGKHLDSLNSQEQLYD